MSKPVKSTRSGDALHEAVKIMAEAHIRRLAAVDDAGGVCGVLTNHEVVNDLEGKYVGYLKDMVLCQEKALQSGHASEKEKQFLENILRSATGTAMITADLECRIDYYNPAVAAMPKLLPFGTVGADLPRCWPPWVGRSVARC